MKDEHIIINRAAIQKRIEKLEDRIKNNVLFPQEIQHYKGQITALKQILSQSTPLIPEIEKAIDYGIRKSFGSKKHSEIRQDYIKNLKLDI